MNPKINCIKDNLFADAALRVVLVEDTGEKYLDCDSVKELSFEDIIRLLIGEDEDGNFAWRVSV